MRNDAWVIVPAKSFAEAKQRLSPLLTASERAMLARIMLRDVLRAAAGVAGLKNVAVVTGSSDVALEAENLGVSVIDDCWATDTNQAIKEGLAAVARQGGARVIALPGDVPAVRSEDVSVLLAAIDCGVVIVPALHDGGTNALALDLTCGMEPCFGPGSFARHVTAARSVGIEPVIARNMRIGIDLDCPRDLFRFLDLKTSTETDRYLCSIHLPARRAGMACAMASTAPVGLDATGSIRSRRERHATLPASGKV